MKQFKADDLVYCPMFGNTIFKLVEHCFSDYPIVIYRNDIKLCSFKSDGRISDTYAQPVLFHATPQNKKLLEQLYDIEFQDVSTYIEPITFKAGDKVYCPTVSNKIYTLESHSEIGYPLKFKDSKNPYSFTSNGKYHNSDKLHSLIPATHDNWEMLCKLYNTHFEQPTL